MEDKMKLAKSKLTGSLISRLISKKFEMKLVNTRLTKGVISKFISKKFKKNVGVDADIQIQELNIKNDNDKVHICLDMDASMSDEELKNNERSQIHLSLDAEMTDEELKELLAKFGL